MRNLNASIVSSRLIALLLSLSVLFSGAVPSLAQTADPDREWNAIENELNKPVAVKADGKKTVYGYLREFDDAGIAVETEAGSDISFRREEVKKVWTADLKSRRNTGKGAAIGAGAGAGAGLVSVLASRGNGDGQAAVAVPVLAILGAGVGAAVGFFTKKKGRKGELIFKR